jgi:Fe-S-cluster-containing hydrogenase component 2
MKRVRPEGATNPPLKMIVLPSQERSPLTLGIDDACCLRCLDEPCIRFSSAESGGGNPIPVCPVDAIHHARSENGAHVTADCVGCGLCAVRCPVGAIGIDIGAGVVVTVAPPDGSVTLPAADDADFYERRDEQRVVVDWPNETWQMVSQRLTAAATDLRQSAFYPLVAHLFTAAGHPAWRPAQGDTSNRIDLVLIDAVDSLPVEVKSRTEVSVVNVKSVQQALENRVVLDQRAFFAANPESSTLVVGYEYPPVRSDVAELIVDIAAAYGISVGLISLRDLYELAVRMQLADEVVPRTLFSELRGSLT